METRVFYYILIIIIAAALAYALGYRLGTLRGRLECRALYQDRNLFPDPVHDRA